MDENLYTEFPLTSVQRAYILGRMPQITFGGFAASRYAEIEYHTLDVDRLEQAINKLIDRHVGLRTIFTENTQRYLREVPHYKVHFSEINSESELIARRNELSHTLFDYTKFPLFHFEVSHFTVSDKFILHIYWDLLLVDGMSIKVLINEMDLLYQTPLLELPKISITFRDYILEKQAIKESAWYKDRYQIEIDYWRQNIAKRDSLSVHLPINNINKFPQQYNSFTKTIAVPVTFFSRQLHPLRQQVPHKPAQPMGVGSSKDAVRRVRPEVVPSSRFLQSARVHAPVVTAEQLFGNGQAANVSQSFHNGAAAKVITHRHHAPTILMTSPTGLFPSFASMGRHPIPPIDAEQ